MSKFKVGDKVRLSEDFGGRFTQIYRDQETGIVKAVREPWNGLWALYTVDYPSFLGTSSGERDLVAAPDEFPADATVLKVKEGPYARHYLHKVGPDRYQLSYLPDEIDGVDLGTRTGQEARNGWFSGKRPSDFKVIKTETKTKEEEAPVTKREFIGQTPVVEGPKYVTPFKIDPDDDAVVTDAEGKHVAEIDLTSDYEYGDDRKMAEAIRDALNEKFTPKPEPEAPFIPRVLFMKRDGEYRKGGSRAFFAYEVAKDRFWWAESREEALKEVKEYGDKGWVASSYDNLYDVTDPHGEQVITGL